MYKSLNINDRIYLLKNGLVKSYINDINYFENKYYKMVCEIPKNTTAKMEITYEDNNPIKQDIFNNKPRFFKKGIPWNYGAIPQTLESKNHIYDETGLNGDGDPLDVIDISNIKLNVGDVITIKVLGILPLIDEGETDWKIIGININDLRSYKLKDFNDLSKKEIDDIYDWFINYKLHSKNIKNSVGMNGQIEDLKLAIKIINDCNLHWRNNFKK